MLSTADYIIFDKKNSTACSTIFPVKMTDNSSTLVGVHHVMDLALHCMNENQDADVDRALVICFGHRIANRGKAVCMDLVCRTWNPYYRLVCHP